jgi:hypothetical protein
MNTNNPILALQAKQLFANETPAQARDRYLRAIDNKHKPKTLWIEFENTGSSDVVVSLLNNSQNQYPSGILQAPVSGTLVIRTSHFNGLAAWRDYTTKHEPVFSAIVFDCITDTNVAQFNAPCAYIKSDTTQQKSVPLDIEISSAVSASSFELRLRPVVITGQLNRSTDMVLTIKAGSTYRVTFLVVENTYNTK